MLTDTALRNLKPKSKTYKAFDRDGMYVTGGNCLSNPRSPPPDHLIVPITTA